MVAHYCTRVFQLCIKFLRQDLFCENIFTLYSFFGNQVVMSYITF